MERRPRDGCPDEFSVLLFRTKASRELRQNARDTKFARWCFGIVCELFRWKPEPDCTDKTLGVRRADRAEHRLRRHAECTRHPLAAHAVCGEREHEVLRSARGGGVILEALPSGR